ncbi:hypothetical protein Q4Q39_15845 [Flavivirga amylovorans]|uniref:Uncharacterized protein n=1 Tax=Flavivirga amylovorans TaxID=870486 RepID=A0ABT8X5Q1_9FLAO|nr:hypothetical protein [Flavivirga amylovorans]MDO5988884.1 hypothetical protein [Flavivirga amylovorans]
MATSIISYKKKYIDCNDNIIIIISLSFIKEVSILKELPDWYSFYLKEVVDEVIDIKPAVPSSSKFATSKQ